MCAKIKAEWDRLRKVVVHTPGMEMFFGLLDPFASLYEGAFSQSDALREHELMRYTLKHDFKVDVLPLKDTIVDISDRRPKFKTKLIELAEESISFKGNEHEVKLACQEMESNRNKLTVNITSTPYC